MAEIYSEVYIQLVFAVKGRQSMIVERIEGQIYSYLTSIIQNRGHRVLAINGMPDHVHILVALAATQSISDLVRDVKSNSSRMIHEQRLLPRRFEWQRSYAVFSYSKSQLPAVKRYIASQKEHHRKVTFEHEMTTLFGKYGLPVQADYGFEWYENDPPTVDGRVAADTAEDSTSHTLPHVATG
jgi:REP element-mobilizing transposase RayT